MTLLKRQDGTPFVIQAYRELIRLRKRSSMLQEIRALSLQHGEYVNLYKKTPEQIEAAFSSEPGFLLGESLRHHFEDIDNLIFCEALPEHEQLLLVVIREGSVYLDARVIANHLKAELMPLMADETAYAIVTSGDVPLTDEERHGGITFPEEKVASFERLNKPLFPRLPLEHDYECQPIDIALRSQELRGKTRWFVMGGILLLVILGSWWWANKQSAQQALKKQQARVTEKRIDPYAIYKNALRSASPSKQLTVVATTVIRLFALPGWEATHVHYTGGRFNIQVRPEGGNMRMLQAWSKEHHFQFDLTAQSAKLSLTVLLASRKNPENVYNTQRIIISLIDRMDHLLQYRSVSIGTKRSLGVVSETPVTIVLRNISPTVLELMGQELQQLPVVLSNVDVSIHSGLLSGSIRLSVWGL